MLADPSRGGSRSDSSATLVRQTVIARRDTRLQRVRARRPGRGRFGPGVEDCEGVPLASRGAANGKTGLAASDDAIIYFAATVTSGVGAKAPAMVAISACSALSAGSRPVVTSRLAAWMSSSMTVSIQSRGRSGLKAPLA